MTPSHVLRLALCATGLAIAVQVASDDSHGSASHESTAQTNTRLVQQAFDAWKKGEGSVFDLLAEQAEWTVAGVSPVSATYQNKEDFMQQAVLPITARLATPITPAVRHIIAQDEHVIVIWDGTATAHNGSTYRNSYAWHMTLEKGQIVRVNAFLDTWNLTALMH